MKVLRFLCGLFGVKKDRRKVVKRQGFGVPAELTEEQKLMKKYFNYPHYIRKHVYNAEPNSRGGCSLFTLTLDEINDVIRQTIEEGEFHYQQGPRIVFKRMFEYKIGVGLNGSRGKMRDPDHYATPSQVSPISHVFWGVKEIKGIIKIFFNKFFS